MPRPRRLPEDPGQRAANYDVTGDGQRFVMMSPAEQQAPSSESRRELVMVQNWTEELKRLVPSN